MEFQKIPMNECGIYMITSPSGKSYIGRSLNLKERLNKYKNLLCSEQQGIYRNRIGKFRQDDSDGSGRTAGWKNPKPSEREMDLPQ